jgi:hypothetical protein
MSYLKPFKVFYDNEVQIYGFFSPDGNGNFERKNAIIFWQKRATNGSSFYGKKIKCFEEKLKWTAGLIS